MAAHGNGTGDDDTTPAAVAGTCISSDVIHRLQDLTVVTSTRNASIQHHQVGAMSSPQTTSLAPSPLPPPLANNAVTSGRSKGCDSSKSKIMAARLERLRSRRLFERRRPPFVASITDELQNNLTVGTAAFRPTAHELIGRFLRPMLAGGGEPLPRAARFIHDADVYAADPEPPGRHARAGAKAKLAWYFFSPLYFHPDRRLGRIPCRRFAGGGGIWKSTGGRWKLAEEGDAANWYGTNLVYYDCEISGLTEWRMREYGIAKEDGGWQQPLVLCEMFRSTSSGGRRRR